MKYKYNVGDRVDYFPSFDSIPNGTPGTVIGRCHIGESPNYEIEWDDGFREIDDFPEANLWPERDLAPLDTDPGDL